MKKGFLKTTVNKGSDTLLEAFNYSKGITSFASKEILQNFVSAYQNSLKTGRKTINNAAIFVNAVLASDFGKYMEGWLGDMFNKGIPSIYDKSIDAVYNATHIGGGKLHRLFDESHTLWDMWDKVQNTLPDDTFMQEVVGYASALWKDVSTTVGIPVVKLSELSYEEMADILSNAFYIDRKWFADFLHVNLNELAGISIGVIAVALNWNKKEIHEFSNMVGSLVVSSAVSANPILLVISIVTLAKSFMDAKRKGNYSDFVKGLSKGGIGTGVFLATSSLIGGPAWVGILTGLIIGIAVRKTMNKVELSQITIFMQTSLMKSVMKA